MNKYLEENKYNLELLKVKKKLKLDLNQNFLNLKGYVKLYERLDLPSILIFSRSTKTKKQKKQKTKQKQNKAKLITATLIFRKK